MLSWLPSHIAEQHILQFACSKAGLVLYSLDPAQAASDPDGACGALEKALTDTNAVALFTLQAGNDVDYLRLCKKVIPETKLCKLIDDLPFLNYMYFIELTDELLCIVDFSTGEQFFSPKFPNLRMPIHCGFDNMDDKYGFVVYKHLLLPNRATSSLLEGIEITDKTPLHGELVSGTEGLPAKGKTLSNDEVLKEKVWPEFSSILEKKYIEVPGTGVIF